MRKLKTADIPAFCRCIKKLGAKDLVMSIAQKANTAKDVWSVGFDALWDLFDLATEQKGEAVIYEFLAGPFEMTAEEVADLDLYVTMENLRQMAAENNLFSFFKSAGVLTFSKTVFCSFSISL